MKQLTMSLFGKLIHLGCTDDPEEQQRIFQLAKRHRDHFKDRTRLLKRKLRKPISRHEQNYDHFELTHIPAAVELFLVRQRRMGWPDTETPKTGYDMTHFPKYAAPADIPPKPPKKKPTYKAQTTLFGLPIFVGTYQTKRQRLSLLNKAQTFIDQIREELNNTAETIAEDYLTKSQDFQQQALAYLDTCREAKWTGTPNFKYHLQPCQS